MTEGTYGSSGLSVEHVDYNDGDKTRTREIDRNTFEHPPEDPCFTHFSDMNDAEKKAAWKQYLEDKVDALDRALGEEDNLPGLDVTDVVKREKGRIYGGLQLEARPDAIDRVRKQIAQEFQNLTYGECKALLDSAGWKPRVVNPYVIGGIVAAVLLIAGAGGAGYYFGTTKPGKVPGKPKNIKARSLGGGIVEVSWAPPDEDDAHGKAESFEVTLSGTGQTKTVAVSDAMLMTVEFMNVANGSYTAVITPVNTSGRGAAVSSSTFSVKEITAVPGAPTDVNAIAAGVGSILATWNAPQGDSNPALTYTVAVINKATGKVLAAQPGVTDLNYTHGNLPPGIYTVKVTAINLLGDGGSTSSSEVTVTAINEDDLLDWNTVINSEIVEYWRERFDKLRDVDEDIFWQNAMVIIDPMPQGENVRSYDDQLMLARFLFYLTPTPALPDAATIDSIAERIRASAVPPFPDGKMDPAVEVYARPLWRSAKSLLNDMGTMPEIRRYKLAGIVRVLEIYLGKAGKVG